MKSKEDDLRRAWEYHKEADNLYHRRFNFFLVAESMLIVSFTTILTVDDKSLEPFNIAKAIAILGLIFTFSWFYVNARLDTRIYYLKKNYLERGDSIYREYMNSFKFPFKFKKLKVFKRDFIPTYALPYSTIILWIFLLVYISNGCFKQFIMAFISTSLVFILIFLIIELSSSYKKSYRK